MTEISDAWDCLVRRSEFNDVFVSPGFARAWWRAYGKARTLRMVVVEEPDGTPRLIAPFYSDDSAPGVLRLIGSFRADYTNLIFAKDDHQSLHCLFSWLQRQDDWRQLAIDSVIGHSSVLHHFRQAYDAGSSRVVKLRAWLERSPGLVYRHWHRNHPYIAGNALKELAEHLSNDYRDFRKHVNWFSRQGALEYRCLTQRADCQALLPVFLQMHISEWTARGHKSLFQQPENAAFYHHLVEELCPLGAVRMDVLSLGETPIAIHFGFNGEARVSMYKSCYDMTFSRHSPGTVLFVHVLQQAVASGAWEVDLLKGLEPYKLKYASDVRTTGSLAIYRSRLSALRSRALGPSRSR